MFFLLFSCFCTCLGKTASVEADMEQNASSEEKIENQDRPVNQLYQSVHKSPRTDRFGFVKFLFS